MKKATFKIVLISSLLNGIAFADDWDFLRVNGYGTLGAVYQDNDATLDQNSFFTLFADKETICGVSFVNYTLLGLQLDAKATEKLSFTLQVVARANNRNSKISVDVDWANAKYQLTDDFDIKVGIMQIPLFIYSDILNVGYSYTVLNLPDMYSFVSMNKYTGIELSHSTEFEEVSLVSTLLYGQASSVHQAIDSQDRVSESTTYANDMFGLALKFISDDLILRTSYLQANMDMNNPEVDAILSQFNALNIPIISNTIEKYNVQNSATNYLNFAAKYDFDNSYVMGEYITSDSKSFIIDLVSWYVAGGYHFETWTPFIVYSDTKGTSNYTAMPSSGLAPELVGAVMDANQVFSQMSESGAEMNLETLSLGFRYTLSDNAVLKFQYDEQKTANATLNIFSSSVNFVF